MILVTLAGCSNWWAPAPAPEPRDWHVFALRYGTSTFPAHQALADGSRDERVPFAWMAWVIRGEDRVILVDTGFDDAELARGWKITPYRTVPTALTELDLAPGDVTDVVVTHAHWDHAGNVAPYTNAALWIQDAEWDWASGRVSPERPERSGVRLRDVQAMQARQPKPVDGDREIAPGVVLHRAGGHTPGVQWVEVRDGERTVVLSSDIAYLYENLDRPIAPGGTRDADADAAAIDRINAVARPARLRVPGHDPLVFERFPAVGEGVVEIR